nr:acetone carboxylase [Rhodoluna sp. KAS3]
MLGISPPNLKCSRAGCSATAEFCLTWRNPKIHTDGRTKVWSACDEHRQFLVDYLETRGFLLTTEKIQ